MQQDLNNLFYIHQRYAGSVQTRLRAYLSYFLGRTYGGLEYFELQQRLRHVENLADLVAILGNYNELGSNSDLDVALAHPQLDCVTLVEVALALHLIDTDPAINAANLHIAKNITNFANHFRNNLLKIRYYAARPNFLARKHFMCVDWLPDNSKYGILTDITTTFGLPAIVVTNKINKFAWLQQHAVLRQTPAYASVTDTRQFVKHLQVQERVANLWQFEPVIANVKYLELTAVLANFADFCAKLPPAAIINIVRPDWELTANIGTNLNISHLGIALREQPVGASCGTSTCTFYHATSDAPKMVVATSLQQYLQKCLRIPTVKGINVYQI